MTAHNPVDCPVGDPEAPACADPTHSHPATCPDCVEGSAHDAQSTVAAATPTTEQQPEATQTEDVATGADAVPSIHEHAMAIDTQIADALDRPRSARTSLRRPDPWHR